MGNVLGFSELVAVMVNPGEEKGVIGYGTTTFL